MHQYLTFIGGFPIRFYGIFFSLAIIFGCIMAYFLLKKSRTGWEECIFDLGLTIAFFGIIGGRLWDVFFFDWDYYGHHLTELLNVWQGGMAIQGGVFLGVLTGVWYCHRHHLDTVHLMDVLAPAIILGQALGRCANLLNGDAFGAPTGSSFGIIYPATTLAHHTYGDQPLWPAEVWEGQLDVVIFALLLLFRTTNHAKGQCFALYVMLYSLARFGLEFLRGDYTEKVLGLVTSAQATSITAFLIAAIFFIGLQLYGKKPKKIRTNPGHKV